MFKKFFALLTLLAVLAVGTAIPAGAALIEGENLLVNGNFESFEEDGLTPMGWTLVTAGEDKVTIEQEESGNHYLMAKGDSTKAYASQIVNLPANSTGAVYELSWKMKGGDSTYTCIEVIFLNSAGNQLSAAESTAQSEKYLLNSTSTTPYNSVKIQMNKDNHTNWKTFTHAFVVPVNTAKLEVRIASRYKQDNRPFDEFSLRRNDKAPFVNYTFDMKTDGSIQLDVNGKPETNNSGTVVSNVLGKAIDDGVLFEDSTITERPFSHDKYDIFLNEVSPKQGNFVFTADMYVAPTDTTKTTEKVWMLLQYESGNYVTNGAKTAVYSDKKTMTFWDINTVTVETGKWVKLCYPFSAADLEGAENNRHVTLTIRNSLNRFAGQMYLDNIRLSYEESALSVTGSTGAAITSIPEDGKVNVNYRLVPSYGETNYSEGNILVCTYGENENGIKQLLTFDVLNPVSTDGLPVEVTANLNLSGLDDVSEIRVFKANNLGTLQMTELISIPKTVPVE